MPIPRPTELPYDEQLELNEKISVLVNADIEVNGELVHKSLNVKYKDKWYKVSVKQSSRAENKTEIYWEVYIPAQYVAYGSMPYKTLKPGKVKVTHAESV